MNLEKTVKFLEEDNNTRIYDKDEILRFLTKNNFDLQKTCFMIKNYYDYKENFQNKKIESLTKKIILDGNIYLFGRDKNNSPILIMDLFKLEKIIETDFIEQALFYLTIIIIENMLFPFYLEYFNVFLKIGKNKFFLKRFSSILKRNFESYFPFRIDKIFIFSEENIDNFDKMNFFAELIKVSKLKKNKLFQFISKDNLEEQFYGTSDNLTQFWPPQTTIENRTILISERILKTKNLKMYKVLNSHQKIGLLENWMENSIFMNSFYEKKDLSKHFLKNTIEIVNPEITPDSSNSNSIISKPSSSNNRKTVLLPNIYEEEEETPFGEFGKSVIKSKLNFEKIKKNEVQKNEKSPFLTQETELNLNFIKKKKNQKKLINNLTKTTSYLSDFISINKMDLTSKENNEEESKKFPIIKIKTVNSQKNLSSFNSQKNSSNLNSIKSKKSRKSPKSPYYNRTSDLSFTQYSKKKENKILMKGFSNMSDKKRRKKSEVNFGENYNPHTYNNYYKSKTFRKKLMKKSKSKVEFEKKVKKKKDKEADFLSVFCCGGSR